MNAGTDAGHDVVKELSDTLRRVFASYPERVGDRFATGLWGALDELGVTRLTLPEDAGGSGGGWPEAAALLLAAGEAAAPIPLAETDLLAGWLLHAAGLPVPTDGPLAAAAGELTLRAGPGSDELIVIGSVPRVGWARWSRRVAVLATGGDGRDLALSLDPASPGVSIAEGTNVAGEPRDTIELDTVVALSDTAVAPDGARELLARRAALARALLLAGAAATALNLSLRYAGERVQFGRHIAAFQAVQQQLALAGAELAAIRAAVDAAVRIAATDGLGGPRAALAVAVAKARAGEGAGVIARIAHQVHGAIGFTEEHSLQLATTRLWAWRDEDGDDTHWNAHVARAALAAGPAGLWPLLTT